VGEKNRFVEWLIINDHRDRQDIDSSNAKAAERFITRKTTMKMGAVIVINR